ncbi:MAG: general secretion pathway protein GspN, partial [Xanthomonadales bacterium]|nr:general secretion pathway protein GspN [Xanthomonadales bacterium]
MAERTLPQRLERAGPLAWLLAAFAGWAILAWVAALAGMGGHIAPAQADPPGALPVSKPAVPDRIGPLSQYGEAAARPLFTTDRRPRAFLATSPEGSDGAAPAQSLDFVLTGVLISPQVQLAILQPTGGGESQRVQVGKSPEGVAGWRLVEVQPRRAVFEGGSGQSTLELRTFGASDADREAIARAAPGARPPPA